MSFYQLFITNFKILYRNWRGLFWNIALPVAIYAGLSLLHINGIPGGGKQFDYSTYLLPGILAMTVMQTGIFGLAYWLIDLKERGVIKRFMVTPLSRTELVGSLICTRLIVMFIQVALITWIGIQFFGAKINGNILAIIILIVFGGAIFLSLGFFISAISKTYDEASPITTVLNLIFTFLGNVFFPAAIFPKGLSAIASKVPLTYLAEGLRDNFTKNVGFADSLHYIFALIVWLIIVFAITLWAFRLQRE